MALKEQEHYSEAGRRAEQVLATIKTVFAFNATDYEYERQV